MIENGRTATIDFLRQAQFDLVLPFTLDLTPLSEGEGKSLVCQRLLRLIPGKRMVCAGLWGGEKGGRETLPRFPSGCKALET